jgi:hypothetical protein
MVVLCGHRCNYDTLTWVTPWKMNEPLTSHACPTLHCPSASSMPQSWRLDSSVSNRCAKAGAGMTCHFHFAHNFVPRCLVGVCFRVTTWKRQFAPQGAPPWSSQRFGRCHIEAAIPHKESHPGRANEQAGTRQVHSKENGTHGKGNLQPRNRK